MIISWDVVGYNMYPHGQPSYAGKQVGLLLLGVPCCRGVPSLVGTCDQEARGPGLVYLCRNQIQRGYEKCKELEFGAEGQKVVPANPVFLVPVLFPQDALQSLQED